MGNTSDLETVNLTTEYKGDKITSTYYLDTTNPRNMDSENSKPATDKTRHIQMHQRCIDAIRQRSDRGYDQSNIFIKIENKYTWVENFVFRLDEIESIWPAQNLGQTAQIRLYGGTISPSISYENFITFFTWMVKESNKVIGQIQVFTLLINQDLSCEWHR